MLTPTQLNYLRQDLSGLANIEYDDVMAELLDHYASLTERKMGAGMSFDDASKWAWAELGSGEGLQQIQTDYEKSITAQVRTRHLEILKSYFRWPAFVTTALIGMLVYLIVPQLPVIYIICTIYTLCLTPLLLLSWGRRKQFDKHTNTRSIVWKYVESNGSRIGLIIPACLNLTSGLVSEDSPTRIFFHNHTSLAVIVGLLLLIYIISFAQLLREQFVHEVKLA